MLRKQLQVLLLGTTALVLPASAMAQEKMVDECSDLELLLDEGATELQSFDRDGRSAIEANEGDKCLVVVKRIEQTGFRVDAETRKVVRETETFQARQTLTETVEIERDAIVEGRVVVRVPNPNVDVEQSRPEVNVKESPVAVAVDQRQATIIVRQRPATVRLNMPQPRITIEQPAPEIIVTMPAPGVSVDQAQPQVSVRMPEPRVTVTQADPQVDVNVQARLAGQDEDSREPLVQTRTQRLSADGSSNETTADSNVNISTQKPVVRVVSTEDELGEVTYNRAKPSVRFESAEPKIEITYAEEPNVTIEQVGEPKITLRRKGEDRRDNTVEREEAEGAAATRQGAKDRIRMSERQSRAFLDSRDSDEDGDAENSVMTDDLIGNTVYTVRGEAIGDLDRIVANRGRNYVVIEHGGFLGIGDTEVAIPANRVAMRKDGTIVVLGLTEDEFEQMPDYDFDSEASVARGEEVRIGTSRR